MACRVLLALLLTTLGAHCALGRPLPGPGHPLGRQLRGSAKATSLSAEGGNASAASDAAGPAVVDTTALALKGGTATAQQAASSGRHSTASVGVGNTTATAAQHHDDNNDDSWEHAPECPFAPISTNSVKDRSGRLWGWSGGRSCTFKAPAYDLWYSAPSCPRGLPLHSAVKDKSGRAWGWFNGTSCAWRDAPRRTLLAAPATATAATPSPNAANVVMPSVTPVTPNAAVPVVLLSAVQPSPAGREAMPAGDTVVTTTYGSGPDAVSCNLVQTQEPGTNLTRSQLKCEKADAAPPAQQAAAPSPVTPPAPVVEAVSPAPAVPAPASNAPAAGLADSAASAPQAASPVASPAPPAPSPVVFKTAPLSESPRKPAPAPDTRAAAAQTVANAFGSTWEAAPACVQPPTPRTAVQDTIGRLWWWEDNRSCAYRNAAGQSIAYDGYVQVKWASAPSCTGNPTLVTSVADAEGRLWWWEKDASCAYRSADNKAKTQHDLIASLAAAAGL